MALTTIDPISALVAIDFQKGIVTLPTVHPIGEIIERSATLAAAFRKHGLPVVLVNVAGRPPGRTEAARPAFTPPADWADIVDELHALPSDLRVTKMNPGAFHGTSLDADLRKLGVTQIVLTGVATSIGVESTARFAYEYGYNVLFVTDAMTDLNAAAHDNAVERIFPRIGETGTTADVLALLETSR